jgi:hypothetical protein
VKLLRVISPLTIAVTLLSAGAPSGQAQAVAPAIPGCTWNCYDVVLPFGLSVREVTEGGSFVTLEDGSVWEIRLPQRPVASSWRAGDFVRLTNIGAPVDRFDILLSHGDWDKAEARLVGRKPTAGSESR